mgnify:CR=1 FL=1
MSNKGTRFFDVFNFMGTTAVTEFSLGELLAVNAFSTIVMFVIIALLAAFFPFLMLFFYIIFLLIPNYKENFIDRVRLNALGAIGYLYFLVDFHYGWLGWSFVHQIFGLEAANKIFFVNTSIFVINVFLIFFGTRFFGDIHNAIFRVVIFSGMLYYGHKMLLPMSKILLPNIVKQYVAPEDEEKLRQEQEKNFRYHNEYYNEIYGIE